MRIAAIVIATAALCAPAAAQQQLHALDLLQNWRELFGQTVQVTGCSLDRATPDLLYCDIAGGGVNYFSIDGASFDATDLRYALDNCTAAFDFRPKCAATLTGTVGASFGSLYITDGSAEWTGAATEKVAAASTSGGSLAAGEYACYGSGSTVLAGLGFIAAADGSYSDLDRTVAGRYEVAGSDVRFSGGHLDGETGRELNANGGFVIGQMAVCEPWR